MKLPEQGPAVEQEPKPAPPLPNTGIAKGYVGVPGDVVPTAPYDPNIASGRVGVPADVPYGQSPEAQQARETRAEQIIDRQEALRLKMFQGQMRMAETQARSRFQSELDAASYTGMWQDGRPYYGPDVLAWREGETAGFEVALAKWKMETGESLFQFDAAKYKDYAGSLLASLQPHEYSYEEIAGYEKAEARAAHGASYGMTRRPGRFDIRDVVWAAKHGLLPEQHVYSPEEISAYEMWEARGAHGPKSFLRSEPFSPEQISMYEAAEARAAHGASYGLKRSGKVVAFQGSPRLSVVDRSDVSWKVDIKVAANIPFGSIIDPESYYRPAVLGKDFDMRDVARFAKTLSSRPVFGKDYNMRDVGAWARKQSAPEFGKDYDMRDVSVWAKSWGQSPEGLAYIASVQEQAGYEAKQAKSREFYGKLGYPQFGGKYEPFDTSMFPAGYMLKITETAEGLRVEPKVPPSISQQVAASKGGLFSNWLSGVTGLSKQPGYQNVEGMVGVGEVNLKPYFAEFIAPFESVGVSLAKFAGVQGLQDVPSTALSSFLGSVKYGKAPLGLVERGLYGGNARSLREAELLKDITKPDSLFLKPSPELAGYAVRPDLLFSSLLGEAALFYGETKAIQGVSKLAHSVYGHTIKGSGLEQRLVNWAWKDPALKGFEKAGLEKVPSMDTSYLKSSSFITGYEENTGLMSSIRGMVRSRLPLSELSVGLPTLSGYVPGAAEEALVKGSVGLGGYDMKWLPRLQAGLEFGDMMASPGAAGFGLTVPAPVASVGLGGAGRVYAFELMKMPAGYAVGFGKPGVARNVQVGYFDDAGQYDLTMSKGGRFFKESMPQDFLGGFASADYPLLEVTKGSGFRISSAVFGSEFGFVKSGGLQLASLKSMFSPAVASERLAYLPLSARQLSGRAFLRVGSLPALSVVFAPTVVSSWASQSKALPMYMQRTGQFSKTQQRQQQYMVDEGQFLSYPGGDVNYQQTLKPSQMFKESSVLFVLQRQRYISGWSQQQSQKSGLGFPGVYSVKMNVGSVNLLRLPSLHESLPQMPRLDYGLQTSKSFLFGVSGFGSGVAVGTGLNEMLGSVAGQALFVGQKPLQLQVKKTLLLSPLSEKMFGKVPFEDVGYYRKLKRRKTRMHKNVGFGKFLRVTPVMTAKEYRKMMLG